MTPKRQSLAIGGPLEVARSARGTRISLVLFVVLAGSTPSWAVDRRVPADFPSIQAAMDASSNGDRVLVSPGRYYERILFPPRKIHLLAVAGPAVTSIDGQAQGTVVTFTGAPDRGAILEGFTITNGSDPDRRNAGGVHIDLGASPTLRRNIIRQNWGYGIGHGVSLFRAASPLIENNEIRHNRSGSGSGGGGGGGIGISGSDCAGQPTCRVDIVGNYIANNDAASFSDGGGIYLSGARASIIGNIIEFNSSNSRGGALSSTSSLELIIENNLIRSNVTNSYGGGIELSASGNPQVIVNNTIVDNEARDGSAVFLWGNIRNLTLSNNIIHARQGGGALHCGMVAGKAPPVARNNVAYAPLGSAYSGSCSVLAGTSGNRIAEPEFISKDNFRLLSTSPGVDEGDVWATSLSVDLDGNPRVVDGNGDGVSRIDVGAYEAPNPLIFVDGFETWR